MDVSWPNCLNVRDLGGLATSAGRPVRAGALIRSDNLARLTEAGIANLRRAGVSRIVDVRSAAECGGDPSPFATEPFYRNMPLSADDDPYDPTLRIDQGYAAMLDHRPKLVAAAVGAIADAPPGAVVVHCHAGKDRAGNIVALALSLVGVPAALVAADYAILGDGIRELFAEQLALVADPVQRRQLAEAFSARPESMLAVLRHLDDTYGGVESYLRHGGLTTGQIAALSARLVG